MHLNGIRAIVCDAVGTLIHPDPPAALLYAQVAARFGAVLAPEVIAARFREAFRREEAIDRAAGLRTSEERERQRWRRIVADVLPEVGDAEACFQELFEHFRRPTAWRCERGTGATLDHLGSAGYRLGLASNYDGRLRPVVAGLPELRPVANHLVISSEVGWRKPAGPFFAALCGQTGGAPQEILYVGDDPDNDYEGARAAGLRAVLFDPENRAREVTNRISRLTDLTERDLETQFR